MDDGPAQAFNMSFCIQGKKIIRYGGYAILVSNLLFQVDESSDSLPLVYDPDIISSYWGKRPRSVATRIVQLTSVAGGFLSRLLWDVVNKKVKEVTLSAKLSCLNQAIAINCAAFHTEYATLDWFTLHRVKQFLKL